MKSIDISTNDDKIVLNKREIIELLKTIEGIKRKLHEMIK